MNNQTDQTKPICPEHNAPMKESEYGGWYCSRKSDSGWCKWRAGDNRKPYQAGPKPTIKFDKKRYYERKFGRF